MDNEKQAWDEILSWVMQGEFYRPIISDTGYARDSQKRWIAGSVILYIHDSFDDWPLITPRWILSWSNILQVIYNERSFQYFKGSESDLIELANRIAAHKASLLEEKPKRKFKKA